MKHQIHSEVRGVALVIVLSFLVLLSVLIISFFTNVTGEVTAGRNTVGATRSLQLADSAVQLVMGQIKEATSRDGYTAWASQPGLIRTYGTGTAPSPAPLAFYKLYSSDKLVVSGQELVGNNWDPEEKDLTDDWPAKKALFTDLNEPVLIQDPSGPINVGGESHSAVYPIVDPMAQPTSDSDPDGIAGFRIQTPPGYAGANPPSPNYNPTAAPADPAKTSNPAPMPVRWIYVLKDGTLTAPPDVDPSGLKVSWTGGTMPDHQKPSAENPIVGRVAFWTDDETSKVNINTAAGDQKRLTGVESGAFWDQPRVNTTFDRNLAMSQVAQYEFQRYPGHPATVALSAVFPSLNREQIASLAPRIAFGGSKGGSVPYVDVAQPVNRKDHRLYASVDELMFKMPLQNGAAREANLPGVITREALNRAKFFLTAHSRVPEVNLFGRPRISIWPIHEVDSPLTRNASDNLLAFCSTIGKQRYYFTRGAANAETNTSSQADYLSNQRNRELYTYLRNLTSEAVPGFVDRGTARRGFETKYSLLERDQILTEIFDYIRCFNLHDGLLMKKQGGRSFTPKKGTPGSGQVVPIRIPGSRETKGFGRIATISEAAILFYATRIEPTSSNQNQTTGMRAVLMLETFSPAQGHTGLVPDLSYTVRGLNTLTVALNNQPAQTKNLNFPAVAENRTYRSTGIHSRIWSGTEGISNNFYQQSGAFKSVPGLDPKTNYPFISQTEVDLRGVNPTSMRFNGGEITVDIAWKDATGTRVEPIQTLKFYFPPVSNLPLPARPELDAGMDFNHRIRGLNYHFQDPNNGNGNPTQNWRMIVDANDVVRSLEPAGEKIQGDLRLIAANTSIPADAFVPHEWYLTNNRHAHSLRLGTGHRYPANAHPAHAPNTPLPPMGKLVAAVNGYNGTTAPDFPGSIKTGALIRNGGAVVALGDWDTGMAAYMDGPYINKPDEGTTSPATGTTDQTPYYTNTDEFNAPTFYSPNRQAHSPVLFGSLSTGVIRQRPWQTLLFRPDSISTSPGHPGAAAPKDHLLLDLFTMPIVEPYAISEPFSTAGKVNMNYQIAPFSYIQRETAMHAALQSIWTMAIPTGASNYKSGAGSTNFRYPVDIEQTLTQFRERFAENRIFVSASEICDLELVPNGQSLPGSTVAEKMRAFWNRHLLTGDNVREMPYAHLHPLLTTKSNTYTVHLRVQALQKNASGNPLEWEEGKDQILSEYRGSSTIERYVDPDDPLLPDFATLRLNDSKGNLEQYYRMRVIGTKKFAP